MQIELQEDSSRSPDTERQYFYIRLAREMIRHKQKAAGRPLTFCVVTFGCQMNARDSEKLRGILKEIGFRPSESEEADLVIYNTCTVRENANTKVYGRLGYLHSLKNRNPEKMIALCGCMMQEKQVVQKLRESYRFVDLIFGTHNIYKLAELIYRVLSREASDQQMIIELEEGTDKIVEDLPSEKTYPFKSGVNIMFGCNNFCSYCIVPYVRGRERSRDAFHILREIQKLAGEGVREVMLLGQNVNSYGKAEKSDITFANLLEQIAQIEGIDRIRFMTSHPKDLSDELISVMAKEEKICPHLHLPLQSGSTAVLKKMNRHYTKEGYLTLVRKLRKALPDISLTTDIIVGFPGETEEDFEETLDVIRQVEFDGAFTFLYSRRTGTPAASMEDQIPEEIAKERFNRLLELVHETSKKKIDRFTGRTLPVLVEEKDTQLSGYLTGRLPSNLVVHFAGDPSLIGRIVPVRLEESKGFYFLGTLDQEK